MRAGRTSIAAAICAATLCVAPAASAEPEWNPSSTQASERHGDMGLPQGASDPRGNIFVSAWAQGSDADHYLSLVVPRLTATMTPHGETMPEPASALASGVAMGFDAAGDAVGVWLSDNGVRAAGKPAGATAWGAPVTLAPGVGAGAPQVAVAADGDSVAVWCQNDPSIDGSHPEVVASEFTASTGNWTAPRFLGRAKAVSVFCSVEGNPRLAGNARGDVAITWAPSAEFVNVRRRPADGVWEDLPPASQALGSDVAVRPDGATILARHRRSVNGLSEPDVLVVQTAPPGADFGGSEILAQDGIEFTPMIRHFSMVPDGSGLIAYSKGTTVLARRLSAAGAWGPTDTVISGGSLQDYQVGLGSEGVAVAAVNWQSTGGQPFAFHGTYQSAAGAPWSPPHQVSRAGAAALRQRSAVVFNPQGEASVWWAEKDSVGWMLRFADLHTRGPLPLNLVVPGQVGTGIESTFSVTPSDIGGVVDVHWEWDDGTDPTTGASVKHIFARAGTYRVKLLLTDVLAKQTMVSCNVVVGPGAPGSCDAPTVPPPDGGGPDPTGGGGTPPPGPAGSGGPGGPARSRPRPGQAAQAEEAQGLLRELGQRVQDDRHVRGARSGHGHHHPRPRHGEPLAGARHTGGRDEEEALQDQAQADRRQEGRQGEGPSREGAARQVQADGRTEGEGQNLAGGQGDREGALMRRAATILAVAALVAVPATAFALTFGAPEDLPTNGRPGGDDLRLGVASDDTVVATWADHQPGPRQVKASVRPPGGAFGAAQELSPDGVYGELFHLGVSPQGHAVAFWREDGTTQVRFAARSPGGAFGPAADAPMPAGYGGGARFDVGSGGVAVAVYPTDGATHDELIATFRDPATGSWSAFEQVVSVPNSNLRDFCGVKLAPSGDALALYESRDGSGDSAVRTKYRPAGGGWVNEQSFTVGSGCQSRPGPDRGLDVDASGRFALLFFAGIDTFGAIRGPGQAGVWTSTVVVPGDQPVGQTSSLAADDAGNVVIGLDLGGSGIVLPRYSAASKTWDASTRFDPPGVTLQTPRVAADRDSGAFVVAMRRMESGADEVSRPAPTGRRPRSGR